MIPTITTITLGEVHDVLRGLLIAGVAPIDMKARGVEMAIGGRQSKTLGCARRNQAVEVGDAIGVECIEGVASASSLSCSGATRGEMSR